MANWDTETADKCELPTLIHGICNRCRDKAYCYRPIRLFDTDENGDKHGTKTD